MLVLSVGDLCNFCTMSSDGFVAWQVPIFRGKGEPAAELCPRGLSKQSFTSLHHIVDGGDMQAAKKPAILQPVQQLLRRLKMAREVTARIWCDYQLASDMQGSCGIITACDTSACVAAGSSSATALARMPATSVRVRWMNATTSSPWRLN